MIKATTKNGTHYLIDMEKYIAKRVRGEQSHNKMASDGEWFNFFHVRGFNRYTQEHQENIEIGKSIYFLLRGSDWRISTDVISIEEVEI